VPLPLLHSAVFPLSLSLSSPKPPLTAGRSKPGGSGGSTSTGWSGVPCAKGRHPAPAPFRIQQWVVNPDQYSVGWLQHGEPLAQRSSPPDPAKARLATPTAPAGLPCGGSSPPDPAMDATGVAVVAGGASPPQPHLPPHRDAPLLRIRRGHTTTARPWGSWGKGASPWCCSSRCPPVMVMNLSLPSSLPPSLILKSI
jgi:hypothetical protein